MTPQVPGVPADHPPPWQYTMDFTIKGTEEECEAKADKLLAYARRIGIPEPFIESEPNSDLDYRR